MRRERFYELRAICRKKSGVKTIGICECLWRRDAGELIRRSRSGTAFLFYPTHVDYLSAKGAEHLLDDRVLFGDFSQALFLAAFFLFFGKRQTIVGVVIFDR